MKIQEITRNEASGHQGKTLIRVHVSATVDPGVLVKQLRSLRDRKDVEEKAKKLSAENEVLRKDIEQLNAQLRGALSGRLYQQLRLKTRGGPGQDPGERQRLTMLVSGEHLVKVSLLERQENRTTGNWSDVS